eukprot:GEMP01061261.1.p1 GENE.GEMP01061261.1~~GEMP01061261.1.p1  ORF type:complete len:271 (+),score=57.41 GEMP01061261.1:122-934(+)
MTDAMGSRRNSVLQSSGRRRSKLETRKSKAESDEIARVYGVTKPERNHMDETEGEIVWLHGRKPDFSTTDACYMKGKWKNHEKDSLEMMVENLMRSWAMEINYKTDPTQWKTIDQMGTSWGANGWKMHKKFGMHELGKYNILLSGVDKDLWDSENVTAEMAQDIFRGCFSEFPFEVLEVFSGPPIIGFSWRHFGIFDGKFRDKKGTGELLNMFGFAQATMNERMEVQEMRIYYNPTDFIKVLEGKQPASALNTMSGTPWLGTCNHRCPFC